MAKSQGLWGGLFDKVHSSATAPEVTVLVYTESVSFSVQSPVLQIYCGFIICPLGTVLTIFSADKSCSRLHLEGKQLFLFQDLPCSNVGSRPAFGSSYIQFVS